MRCLCWFPVFSNPPEGDTCCGVTQLVFVTAEEPEHRKLHSFMVGHKQTQPIFTLKTLPLLHWTENKLALFSGEKALSLFSKAVCHTHPWKDSLEQNVVSALAYNMCRNTGFMENCLPILQWYKLVLIWIHNQEEDKTEEADQSRYQKIKLTQLE